MAKAKSKANFHGIEVFEILENGNLLNAIYTNTNNYHSIENEIARKNSTLNNGIIGTYNTRYIERIGNKVIKCTLEITPNDGVYIFEWKLKGKLIWTGIGLMAGSNHIAVSYVNV
jgi:hypothetical protein